MKKPQRGALTFPGVGSGGQASEMWNLRPLVTRVYYRDFGKDHKLSLKENCRRPFSFLEEIDVEPRKRFTLMLWAVECDVGQASTRFEISFFIEALYL